VFEIKVLVSVWRLKMTNHEIILMPGYTREIVDELNKNLEDLAKGKVSREEAIVWGVHRPLKDSDYKPNNDYKVV